MKSFFTVALVVGPTLLIVPAESAMATSSPRLNQPAINACNADGATIKIAIAAFEAANPHTVPTQALLISKGFLTSWSKNFPYYTDSISKSGVLMVAAPSYFAPVKFTKAACQNAGRNAQTIGACLADGAVVQTALDAFEFTNPHTVPTKAGLLAASKGGPYLNSWPAGAPYYSYSISKTGYLEISAPSRVPFKRYSKVACLNAR
ncbi:MAG TPA: hypothetical protein VIJ86_08210 [Acidimicrobiales bacterium]